MKIHKRLNRNVRRTDLHPCTSRRVKHPCRHDNRSARFSFDDDDVSAGALLTVIAPHRTSVECMPPVVNLYFLPNMGRITPRLRSIARRRSSRATISAWRSGLHCVAHRNLQVARRRSANLRHRRAHQGGQSLARLRSRLAHAVGLGSQALDPIASRRNPPRSRGRPGSKSSLQSPVVKAYDRARPAGGSTNPPGVGGVGGVGRLAELSGM
jgi:hypothetical protein